MKNVFDKIFTSCFYQSSGNDPVRESAIEALEELFKIMIDIDAEIDSLKSNYKSTDNQIVKRIYSERILYLLKAKKQIK